MHVFHFIYFYCAQEKKTLNKTKRGFYFNRAGTETFFAAIVYTWDYVACIVAQRNDMIFHL